MKYTVRVLTWILAAVLLLGLCACGAETAGSGASAPDASVVGTDGSEGRTTVSREDVSGEGAYTFDAFRLAQALGLDTDSGEIGVNCHVADWDGDGHPEYLILVHDAAVYPTDYPIVLDLDAGCCVSWTGWAGDENAVFSYVMHQPDTGDFLVHYKYNRINGLDEYYMGWNGSYFDQVFSKRAAGIGEKEFYLHGEKLKESEARRYEEALEVDGGSWKVAGDQALYTEIDDILEAIARAVGAVRPEATKNAEKNAHFEVTSLYFNKDRTVAEICCGTIAPWEVRRGVQYWTDPYLLYYADARSGEFLGSFAPPEFGEETPELDRFREEHGF